MQRTVQDSADSGTVATAAAAFPIVLALSFCHLLNDMMQSLLPAIYPVIKASYNLDFGQVGLITLAFQLTASVLQPVVGMATDRRPQPFSMVAGMGLTVTGLVILAYAGSYAMLLLGAALIGTGSSVFHPEAVRMARIASGGRHGFAQSLFQVGGQSGQAIGPLLAAFIVVPRGQASVAWFSVAAFLAMIVLYRIGLWYATRIPPPTGARAAKPHAAAGSLRTNVVVIGSALVLLMLSKSAYTSSINTYYTFYLIETFGVSVPFSQTMLFVFLAAQVIGSLIGGHVGDRLGRRTIIWFSILGALPLTLALPYASLYGTVVLSILIAMVMASAFPAILVYALEMFPSRIGMVAGLFYGLTFGLGAISAAALGELADRTSLAFVFELCALLPLLGLCAAALPDLSRRK
jgi:FSR family fosmidomycin resistance protein-like MFS transporter